MVLAVVLAILGAASPSPPAKPRVGIVELTPLNGVSLDYAALVSDALRTEIYRTGAFELIDRSVLKESLEETQLRQLGVVDNAESLIGKLKGVDKMIVGSVGRVEARYVFSARRLDLATGQTEVAISNQSAATVDEVLRTVGGIAQRLAGTDKPATEMARVLVTVFQEQGEGGASQPSVGEVLTDAIARGLGDDQALHVFSPFYVAAQCSSRSKTYADTARPEIASDLARAFGATRIVSGKVQRVGETWVVVSTVTDAQGGRVLGTERTVSKSLDELLAKAATDHLTRIHKVLSPFKSEPVRIDDVTTHSLEAYRSFLQAFDLHMVGRFADAHPLLERAISLDPQFAMAMSVGSCNARFRGDDALAEKMFKQAMALYDQLSAKEQLWLRGLEAWMKNDFDLLKLYYLQFTHLYPDDSKGWLYLGLATHMVGRDPKGALPPLDKAIEINPTAFPNHKAKAEALEATGDKAGAKKVISAFIQRFPASRNLEDARAVLARMK